MLKEKQIKKKLNEIRQQKREISAMLDNAEDEEYDRLETLSDELEEVDTQLYWLIKAVSESTQPKNEWFINFCQSIPNGKYLSEKQWDCFVKYAKCSVGRYEYSYSAIINGVQYHTIGRKLYQAKLPKVWKQFA